MILHKATEYLVQPWKNGQGTTTEIARRMDQQGIDFIWRLSIAQIKQDGVFSDFTGVDRSLMLLSGKGINLTFDQEKISHKLDQTYDLLSFDGGRPVACSLIEGETKDFNVMSRQGVISHKLDIVKDITKPIHVTSLGQTILVFCLEANLTVTADRKSLTLEKYDTLELDVTEGEPLSLIPETIASCAVIHLKKTEETFN